MEHLQVPFDGAAILTNKRRLKKQLSAQEGLVPKRIAIASGSTVGEVRNILELFLLDRGIQPTFFEGEYGLFFETVVFDDGALAAFQPDLLYIHTSVRNLQHWPAPGDSAATAAQKLEDEAARFEAVWAAAQKLGCPVVQNNFEDPLWRNFGNLDAADPRGRVRHVRALNQRMAAWAEAHSNFYIHDLAYLSARHGVEAWCDAATWYAYKYCCAVDFIPHLCHSLATLMGALFGRVKKGLVCDLDNTLWGGVIGDEGAEGIEFGEETPAGMAYAELQEYLKTLSKRGILLSVASKNELAAAEAGFARADSVLAREDFVCFEANWQPKSQSIAAIANTMNILPDSLVFIDDNPAEREEVARALPEVAAPPVAGPERTIALLEEGGYFEAAAVSEDDLRRGEMMRQNAVRAQSEAAFADYGEYLKSLAMRAEIGPFRPAQVERVAQLINKTNQFNLTTRRYTPAEVQACMDDPATITLAGRLVDKFGDNGIVSALIARRQGAEVDIELWVMSCRVFKRGLEQAMFDALVAAAQQAGAKAITGRYLPTAKNLLVKDFYATIGFSLVRESDEERVFRYELPAVYTPLNTVIALEGEDG